MIDQVALVEAIAKAVEHELEWETPEGSCCDGSIPCQHEPEPGCAECATSGWPCGYVAGIVEAVEAVLGTPQSDELEKLQWRERGMLAEMAEVENVLAEGLGYTHDAEYGWVIGDHTPVTLAMEARRRLQEGA